jgi:hypothetical protein
MKSIPKIYANFKDGNISFYFNNIKGEIKQSPKLMVLYQFSLKSVYKFQTSWSDIWDNILIPVTELRAVVQEASRRTLNAKSWADRRVAHMEFRDEEAGLRRVFLRVLLVDPLTSIPPKPHKNECFGFLKTTLLKIQDFWDVKLCLRASDFLLRRIVVLSCSGSISPTQNCNILHTQISNYGAVKYNTSLCYSGSVRPVFLNLCETTAR